MDNFPIESTNDYSFTLDRVPPVIVITNPVNAAGSTFTQPYLQLQGCGNEPLLAIE
jgi:hypothetical protein